MYQYLLGLEFSQFAITDLAYYYRYIPCHVRSNLQAQKCNIQNISIARRKWAGWNSWIETLKCNNKHDVSEGYCISCIWNFRSLLSQISHIGIYLAMSESTYRLRNAIFRTFPKLCKKSEVIRADDRDEKFGVSKKTFLIRILRNWDLVL